VLREAGAVVVAAGLRRAAMDARHDVADELNHRMLMEAADAICRSDGAQRRFDWPRGMGVLVNAREVRLEVVGR
jgi:hypothetical protein